MNNRGPKYTKDEHARRGNELYERIRPQLPAGCTGKILAIDIESGAYQVADDTLAATDKLFSQYPAAQPWIVRIDYPSVHRIGHSPYPPA